MIERLKRIDEAIDNVLEESALIKMALMTMAMNGLITKEHYFQVCKSIDDLAEARVNA